MPEYTVRLWIPVVLKVPGVPAESQTDAIAKALAALDLHNALDLTRREWLFGERQVEQNWAEDEPIRALVDEAGDAEYERSAYYVSDGEGWRYE